MFIRWYFIAGQGGYWFLLVLAESLVVAAILIKYDLEKLLYAIDLCGLILGLLYDVNFNMLGIQYINRLCYLILDGVIIYLWKVYLMLLLVIF